MSALRDDTIGIAPSAADDAPTASDGSGAIVALVLR